MRLLTFSSRNAKEILRDPLNVAFSLGFPVILLFLMSAIGANAPVSIFEIETLTPGITVFGLSFMTLFSATLIARDRETALLQRLYTTPLTSADFIFGYVLPILPIAVAQCALCYIAAVMLGLTWSVYIVYAVLLIIPVSLLFIALGLLFGSILNTKQVGGICGALLTILTAWFSGAWFDISLIGGVFERLANILPYIHAVALEKAVLAGNFSGIFPHIWWIVCYGAVALAAAVLLFLRQMKKQ